MLSNRLFPFLVALSLTLPAVGPAWADDDLSDDDLPEDADLPEGESEDGQGAEELPEAESSEESEQEAQEAEESDEDLEDLEDLDDLELFDEDPDVDNEGIYNDYKAELRGESAAEELDAWYRYLDVYPKSRYEESIRARMAELEDAAFDELVKEDPKKQVNRIDPKMAEMDVAEPGLGSMNPNTRKRFEFGLLWGYKDYLNYQVDFEWAFRRKFSLFGGIKHEGRGFGAALQAGAKYALVKDVRTGIVLSGAFSVKLGYSQLDNLSFTIEPWVGFAWLASKTVQLQTSLAFDFRVDKVLTWVLWDAMVVINPTEKVGIYIESKQKHSLHATEGLGTQYLGFYQAGVGAKIRPNKKMEITLGANVPYFWRLWKDYQYVGIHADLVLFFGKTPDKQ